MTIKKQFLIIIILLTTIPFIIVPWAGYFYIENIMEEQLLLQSQQNLGKITKDIEQVLDSLIASSNAITLDQDITGALKNNEASLPEVRKITKKLSNINAAHLYAYNADIYIYNKQADIYTTTAQNNISSFEAYKKAWIKETLNAEGFFVWKEFSGIPSEKYEQVPIIGMARNILDINGRTVGVLAIELFNERNINSLLFAGNEFQNTERYLVDHEGNIILEYINNSEKSKLFSKQWFKDYIQERKLESHEVASYKGEKQVVSIRNISKAHWKVVQIIPYRDMLRKVSYYRNFTIGINLIVLVIIICADILSINRLTRSITKLRDAMRTVKDGKFIQIAIPKTNQEVEELSKDFNIMSTKLNELFEENRRIYEEKQRTKLEALQSQIQPHFLFNTLNGIKWLCIMEGAKTAEKMIISLGYILEYSLSKNRDIITLKEEITCLNHYIELQKMRYGETFRVVFEVEEELYDLEVPILFLQPLIENAIIHGLQGKDDLGIIKVRLFKSVDSVNILVEDNGCGMSDEQIKELLTSTKKSSGIGVKNVQERIQIYYGNDSTLRISRNEAGGITIAIKLLVRGGLGDENHNS
ncbi:sensor histidine kinase [Cellulosilyticum sp. I15G10I2]|uniref:sensor histidine kinase n=1 Tax=Cellulosilyticum sp. I15G10I2 TaxID=1892843 RepID=UPI00085C747D|nr:sensor histidine kinase [Cellulosilyticum sp. I15G10I2]